MRQFAHHTLKAGYSHSEPADRALPTGACYAPAVFEGYMNNSAQHTYFWMKGCMFGVATPSDLDSGLLYAGVQLSIC